MMKQLLKNLVDITAQRENSRLAGAVITGLYELTKVKQIRVLDIFSLR